MTTALASDLRRRWAPSPKQIATAKTIMAGYDEREVDVLVPIALRNKTHGFWTEDVEVDPIEGVYALAYTGSQPVEGAVDYGMAREIVEKIATVNSANGTGSWAVIHPDGGWAVFEI